jgi:hypothetical protein
MLFCFLVHCFSCETLGEKDSSFRKFLAKRKEVIDILMCFVVVFIVVVFVVECC